MPEPVLVVENVVKHYPVPAGWLRHQYVHAVDGVSFEIYPGQTLALVGESGSGKSTLGRMLLMLERPTSGRVLYKGQDLSRLRDSALRIYRKSLQMVFQDPMDALNPRMTVLETVMEPLVLHGIAKGRVARDRALELLERVGLKREHAARYPHQLSGGQQQRVGIARALATEPEFVVFDEPTSALDVSVQAQLLNLTSRLRVEYGLSSAFISHDLTVVSYVADRVAVMYLGQIVELGTRRQIFESPQHPYTVSLMSSMPGGRPLMPWKPLVLEGEIPSPLNPPSGCRFHTRCPFAEASCRTKMQRLEPIKPGHLVACHQVMERGGYDALEAEKARRKA
jgi:oligopeptide/dipeptide ABC transporter ATP-binding protein